MSVQPSRTLSFEQLQMYLKWTKERILGAQVQEVWLHGEILMLECYLRGAFHICFDLRPAAPGLFIVDELLVRETAPKPVVAFLKSHLRGQRIIDLELIEDQGRVVRLASSRLEIDFEMIPRSPNLHVRAQTSKGEKSIHWAKPKERPKHAAASTPAESDEVNSLDWVKYNREWLELLEASSRGLDRKPERLKHPDPLEPGQTASEAQAHWLKALGKKQKAIESIRATLEGEMSPAAVKKVRAEAQELLLQFSQTQDSKLRFLAESQFEEARKLERKRKGTEDRLRKLNEEIEALKKIIEDPALIQSNLGLSQSLRTVDGSRTQKEDGRQSVSTRKLQLESGALALLGKSAADNLKLLRQARAWDYWLHLKDSPSAYAILKREKNQSIADSELLAVGEWLLKTSKRGLRELGRDADILVVECRHVRPIKGDRIGRVTYTNPMKTLRVRLKT